jgi:hypothetical protein
VTTLYFEAENEDDLRKVGYSKERRIDPQIVVGLLVDRTGFPLEIGCFGSTVSYLQLAHSERHLVTGGHCHVGERGRAGRIRWVSTATPSYRATATRSRSSTTAYGCSFGSR